MGWVRPMAYFFREKEWAKREFHDGWERVIVCFVKNHTRLLKSIMMPRCSRFR